VEPTQEAIETAYGRANPCGLCPRNCRVNRAKGETGYCGVRDLPLVASAFPHFGEERPLVGRGGSGTIFLGGCSLKCVFCQNASISHGLDGRRTPPDAIAEIMMRLEKTGCENVNLVTPSHVVPWLMQAVRVARLAGLKVPIVYNCAGYDRIETLRLLKGTVDIYMPDAKYWDSAVAGRYSHAPDYPAVMRAALKEMHRQVGDLQIKNGVAGRGLLVRHLVMPGRVAGSMDILNFIAKEISPNTYVNVMDQYSPCYQASRYDELDRRLTWEEYQQVRRHAAMLGLNLL